MTDRKQLAEVARVCAANLRARANASHRSGDGTLSPTAQVCKEGAVVIGFLAAALLEADGELAEAREGRAAVATLGEGEQNTSGAAEQEVGKFIYERIEYLIDAKAGTTEGSELGYLAAIVSDVEEYNARAADWSAPQPPEPSR